MRPADLTEASLLDLLLDDAARASLVAAMRGDLPLQNHYVTVARACRATAAQLRALAARTAAAGHDDLLDALVAHPAMPVDVLDALCDQGRCVSALGHLAGPRSLLRRVVARHGYLEAVVSLGLGLYADPTVPLEEFAAFLDEHRACEPLLRALSYVEPRPPEKGDLVPPRPARRKSLSR